jgi:hypothetical protein
MQLNEVSPTGTAFPVLYMCTGTCLLPIQQSEEAYFSGQKVGYSSTLGETSSSRKSPFTYCADFEAG